MYQYIYHFIFPVNLNANNAAVKIRMNAVCKSIFPKRLQHNGRNNGILALIITLYQEGYAITKPQFFISIYCIVWSSSCPTVIFLTMLLSVSIKYCAIIKEHSLILGAFSR